MKCKKCGEAKKEVRVAPIVGDPLCKKCWDDVQTDMRRKGADSKETYSEYVRTQYKRWLRS
jgi:hypothetical protein